jgi:hypothetical protein
VLGEGRRAKKARGGRIDMLSQMDLNLINALVVCVFIFIGFFIMWSLKSKYQKQSVDHILGEFITREGTGYTKLLRAEGGIVHLEPDEKKGIKGKTFPVAEKASFLVDFPEGPWCPRFLKCKIKKVVFREFDVEPVSNLYDLELVMKPELLYNIDREKVTEVGMKIAQETGKETGLLPEKKSKLSNNMKFILLILGIAAAGGIIYLFATVMQLKSVLGM